MKNLFLMCVCILSMCNNNINQIRYVIDYTDLVEVSGIEHIKFIANTPQGKNMYIWHIAEYDLAVTINYYEKIIIITHPIIEDFTIIKILLSDPWHIDTLEAEKYLR